LIVAIDYKRGVIRAYSEFFPSGDRFCDSRRQRRGPLASEGETAVHRAPLLSCKHRKSGLSARPRRASRTQRPIFLLGERFPRIF
jgi:hypothetical protein